MSTLLTMYNIFYNRSFYYCIRTLYRFRKYFLATSSFDSCNTHRIKDKISVWEFHQRLVVFAECVTFTTNLMLWLYHNINIHFKLMQTFLKPSSYIFATDGRKDISTFSQPLVLERIQSFSSNIA